MSGSHGVAAVAGPEGTQTGLRAIRISAAVLAVAAAAQLIVVGIGGSAGLFAAALDNLGDVISTVALALAFMAARRAADDRYTFGYQRLEDIAGIVVVMVIWARAADPLAGLLITVAIVAIAWDASRHVLARVMDAVDPSIVSKIEHAARETPGVAGVGRIQARWAGRSLYVTLTVAVDGSVPVSDAHGIAEAVHHHIIHDLPGVAQVDVHVDPWEAHAQDAHRATSDHPPIPRDEHGHHH